MTLCSFPIKAEQSSFSEKVIFAATEAVISYLNFISLDEIVGFECTTPSKLHYMFAKVTGAAREKTIADDNVRKETLFIDQPF